MLGVARKIGVQCSDYGLLIDIREGLQGTELTETDRNSFTSARVKSVSEMDMGFFDMNDGGGGLAKSVGGH